MPIYEYKCRECHAEYEEIVSLDSPAAPPCPSCHSSDVEKKMSAFGGAITKGNSCGNSGFS
jgi:putative FmdB family regulatory protein